MGAKKPVSAWTKTGVGVSLALAGFVMRPQAELKSAQGAQINTKGFLMSTKVQSLLVQSYVGCNELCELHQP
jgi:primosomal replication protein N